MNKWHYCQQWCSSIWCNSNSNSSSSKLLDDAMNGQQRRIDQVPAVIKPWQNGNTPQSKAPKHFKKLLFLWKKIRKTSLDFHKTENGILRIKMLDRFRSLFGAPFVKIAATWELIKDSVRDDVFPAWSSSILLIYTFIIHCGFKNLWRNDEKASVMFWCYAVLVITQLKLMTGVDTFFQSPNMDGVSYTTLSGRTVINTVWIIN